jgi:hypothetical protein
MRACIAVIGPPSSGKSYAIEAQAGDRPYALVVKIGDAVRGSAPGACPEDVALLTLQNACTALPGNGVLLIDGLKRSSHVLLALMILKRNRIRLAAAIELPTPFEPGNRGRPLDDVELPARRERYAADLPRLLDTLKAAAPVLTSSEWELAWQQAGVEPGALRSTGIDWSRYGGPPAPPELPILMRDSAILEMLAVPGRYLVSAKCDGERAFLFVQSQTTLWLLPVG